jgi:hypothetical protein
LKNRRTCDSSDGGGGRVSSRVRTIADPRICRDTSGNGPLTRFSATNQIASSDATTATTEPPAASALLNRVARARARSRDPNIQPIASPIAANPISTPVATLACASGLSTTSAIHGAITAPTASPTRSPPNERDWSASPRR